MLCLQVELEEQLAQLGSLGSSSSLSAVLISLLGGKAALDGLNLPQPREAVLMAFIVAVAVAELSRAALAPLPDLGKRFCAGFEPVQLPIQQSLRCSTFARSHGLCASASNQYR